MRLIPLIVTAILLSGCQQETIDFENLVERKNVYYKKFSQEPYSGLVEGIQQGKIKNGKREGPWFRYYPNGNLKAEYYYENGMPEGPSKLCFEEDSGFCLAINYEKSGWGFWRVRDQRGQIIQERRYNPDGIQEGYSKYWYGNGQLAQKHFYWDGKLHLDSKNWDKNGQLRNTKDYTHGELVTEHKYDEGRLYLRIGYQNGEPVTVENFRNDH